MNPRSSKSAPTRTTAPSDRVSFKEKLSFGVGSIPDYSGTTALNLLLYPIYNVILQVNPALLGTAMAAARVWDAFTDPVMGSISDNSRSRYGKRRPFMFFGAVLMSISFAALWMFGRGWSPNTYFIYFVVVGLVFYTASTIYSVPWGAVGLGLTADYHERTRVQIYRTFFASAMALALPWVFNITQWQIFDDTIEGVRFVGVALGLLFLATGLCSAFFIKESRIIPDLKVGKKIPLWPAVKSTFANRDYRVLCILFILISLGISLVNHLGFYINTYYVHGGDLAQASVWEGLRGTTYGLCKFLSIPLVAFVAHKKGKRYTLMVCLGLALFANLSKWYFYDPNAPWLQLLVSMTLGPSQTAIFLLFDSMTADSIDADELRTGKRREGMYNAVTGWIRKTGQAVSIFFSGLILVYTGFEATLGGEQADGTITVMRVLFSAVPAVAVTLAMIAAMRYSITEEVAYQLKDTLSVKRQQAGAESQGNR